MAIRAARRPAAGTHAGNPPAAPAEAPRRHPRGAAGRNTVYFVLPDEEDEDSDEPVLLSLPLPPLSELPAPLPSELPLPRLEVPVPPVLPDEPDDAEEPGVLLDPDSPLVPLPVDPLPTDSSDVLDEPLPERLERHLLKSSLNFL